MNRLLVAVIAGAFALISASAFAQTAAQQDNTMQPLSKMDTEQAKAARQAAQEKWAKMTPEQQAAARKTARQKKLSDANAIDMIANDNMQYVPPTAAEQAASKAVPKPTKEERKADTKAATKATTGQ